jgi:hypothetical protein
LLAKLPRPAQHCTIFTQKGCAPKTCQARDPPTPTQISVLLDHAPPSLSSQGSIDTQDLHSASLCPSGTPSPCSKGLLLHLS